MVNVTDKAVEFLDQMRAEAVERVGRPLAGEPEPALRLVLDREEIGITLDRPTEGDQVVAREGHPVLLVDQKVGDALDGTTIDVQQTPEGEQLIIGE